MISDTHNVIVRRAMIRFPEFLIGEGKSSKRKRVDTLRQIHLLAL
jgi:hypothetical protein